MHRVAPRTASADPARDAWGTDDEEEHHAARTVSHTSPGKPAAVRSSSAQARTPQTAAPGPINTHATAGSMLPASSSIRPTLAQSSSQSCAAAAGEQVCSLQSISLAVVGTYIAEYVDALGSQLSFLPPDVKMTLLAVARRHRALSDAVLLALADPSWRCLDVSGSGSQLTADGFLQALRLMPQLQALDISGCTQLSSPAVLSVVSCCCRRLKLLRCGAGPACNAAMERSLPPVLPGVVRPSVATDNWEDAFSDDELDLPSAHSPVTQPSHNASEPSQSPLQQQAAPGHTGSAQRAQAHAGPAQAHAGSAQQGSAAAAAAAAAAPVPQGQPGAAPRRLQDLRHVVWPLAPAPLVQQAQAQCPAIRFHGTMQPCKASSGRGTPGSMDAFELLRSRQQAAELGDALGLHQLWPHSASAAMQQGAHAALARFLDPAAPMDEAWVAGLPASTWEGLPNPHFTPFVLEQRRRARLHQRGGRQDEEEEEEEEEELLPLAVRFRQAYIDRANRLKQKAAKDAQRALLRQLRASPALQAVSSWLDDF